MESQSRPHGKGLGASGMTDALKEWNQEVAVTTPIEELRLDQNERLVVPFTTSKKAVDVHYLDYSSLRGYVRCNRNPCMLCRIGRKADTRDLLPVYDVVSRAVGVLAVSPNVRPQALKPQLVPVLVKLAANEHLLLALRKFDSYRFEVTILALPADADDGAEKIAEFITRLDAGEIDLASIYQQLPDAELAALPEVAAALKARGMQP